MYDYFIVSCSEIIPNLHNCDNKVAKLSYKQNLTNFVSADINYHYFEVAKFVMVDIDTFRVIIIIL